jgi:hypothetical protein
MLISYHISTRRHNPEESDLNLHRLENIESLLITHCVLAYTRFVTACGSYSTQDLIRDSFRVCSDVLLLLWYAHHSQNLHNFENSSEENVWAQGRTINRKVQKLHNEECHNDYAINYYEGDQIKEEEMG